MIYRPAKASDFNHLETFVWQAIFPAFDLEELTDEQRAENDALVSEARPQVQRSLEAPDDAVFVAVDPKLRRLAGYVVVAVHGAERAELVFIVARKAYWGKGVASKLLEMALEHAGQQRMVSAGVRYFNDRAKAFLTKHGFEDTGEAAGEEHAIPRTLLIREAVKPPETTPVVPKPETQNPNSEAANFPTEADEPYFEELPDYSLTTEEAPLFELGDNALRAVSSDETFGAEPVGNNALSLADDDAPLFSESTLDEGMLDELSAFIARAKAKKAGQPIPPAPPTSPVAPPPPPKRVVTPPSAPPAAKVAASLAPTPPTVELPINKPTPPAFEFAFDAEDLDEEEPLEKTSLEELVKEKSPDPIVKTVALDDQPTEEKTTTKSCPVCGTELPQAARFCYNCGSPQADTSANAVDTNPLVNDDVVEEEPTLLELPPLEKTSGTDFTDPLAPGESGDAIPPNPAPAASPTYTLAGLKQDFRDLLTARVSAYFGPKSVDRYLKHLQQDERFQQVRDSGLNSLLTWLKNNAASTAGPARITNVQADLVEYFLVESAAELHGRTFPQRALRYQSADPETVDFFRLVMDYLNFAEESDTVYTDFVTMPKRALRNATNAFLKASKDERILFICDQSLISQAKNGFAMTDAGVYWKNIFQPPGVAVYRTMAPPRIEAGHLVLDTQFFDAGPRLNLKLALLLDKLRRL